MTKSDFEQLDHREVDGLIALLRVADNGNGCFSGANKLGGVGRVFGGQIIAQALMAAQNSVVEDRVQHSLHAYFTRPGAEGVETTYKSDARL